MKKIELFLLLSIFPLFMGCTSKKKSDINIDKVSIYFNSVYRKKKTEYIKLWINDKIIFSDYYWSKDSLDYFPIRLASIVKQINYIKIKVQIRNIDTAYYHSTKESVDTTFYYNIKNINKLGIGYLKAYHGFIIYDGNDKDWWKVE